MAVRVTLDDCGKGRQLRGVPAGRYAIEYNDSTHLKATEWVRLGHLDIRENSIDLSNDESEQYYTITKDIAAVPANGQLGTGANVRVVEDTLALALGRLGLVTPPITPELREDLLKLNEHDGVVIVPDTNALHNGSLHWLLRVLRQPSVWLLPVVASLTTIQNRDALIKALVNKEKPGNLAQALRSRGLVNGALGLLQRNRGRCQVVEIDPSLLRYQKTGSSTGTDPDQSDVLEDRLIIEAIHGVLRTMRTRTARRVVTSDVNIARILEAEGIETLFVPTITLGTGPIDCLRYDALARTFVGAPLRALVWELTHAFSTIRLNREGEIFAQLECYWPGKTPAQWSSETLQCEFLVSTEAPPVGGLAVPPSEEAASTTNNDPTPELPLIPSPVSRPESAAEVDSADNNRAASSATAGSSRRDRAREAKSSVKRVTAKPELPKAAKKTPEITTVLPRASFPQMLQLLASARRLGQGSASEIVANSRNEPVTVDNARRALEIWRRVNLLSQAGEVYRTTKDVEMVDIAFQKEDLDAVSSVMLRFAPYRLFLERLQQQGSIARDDVISVLRELLGPVGSYEAARLPRFHTLLGQAWTRGDRIMDGSRRPTDRDATDAFESAFTATASVGIASVRDLLPRFCEMTQMSPWAAKKQIQKFVADRLLPQYTFQPAAGGKPITKDEIVTGSIDSFTLEPVVIDRLNLGHRPVFTIEGPSR